MTIKNLQKLQVKLSKEKNILGVYLFGSILRGNTSKLSDLDIGIVFVNPFKAFKTGASSLDVYSHLFSLFTSHVANLDKLDLVFLQRTPLSLQKEVVTEGKILYAKDIQSLLGYKERVILKYADLKPLMENFYQEVAKIRLTDFKL